MHGNGKVLISVGIFFLLSLVVTSGCISATGSAAVNKAKIVFFERDAGHSGTVYIDGKYLGEAPVANPKKGSNPVTDPGETGLTTVVDPGTYQITIVDPKCHNNMIRNVTVEPGEKLVMYGYCV